MIYLTAKAHSAVCNRCMHILPMGMSYSQELKTEPGYHVIIIGLCCMTEEEAEEMRKELAAAEKTKAKKEKPADPEGSQLKFYGME